MGKIMLNGISYANSENPTPVEANPQETGTADLTKVKIGATVYDIPTGGGGYTLVDGQAVDTGARWIDGTSPIYAVYLSNGITSAGFSWSTTVGRVLKALAFSYDDKGMSEWDTTDITPDLGCQNNFDGTFRVINLQSANSNATLLYVV